ncbi:ORF131 [Xestia c-nigrum granulovirus]|uniref:ORF131 n=1 Tax=Xestia c-nigrum granulosis virus TaxID=51677 RepID=Q9PYR4_GVXN|nr:ORF131 [Xestia c-nigrum granulovirus]AAF05245.1 ORF131 [Xestia c-nigrum granulovirus]
MEMDKFLYMGHSIAKSVGYANPQKAIRDHVRPEWRKTWSEIVDGTNRSPLVTSFNDSHLPANWQPNTVFITEAGVWALIIKSKLPAAEKFQKWLFEEVLPELRRTGKYDMSEAASTSTEIVNYDKKLAEAQIENLQLKLDLSQTVAKSENKIAELERNYERQIAEYKDREYKHAIAMKDLLMKANATMVQFGVNTLLAEDNIKQNEKLRARIGSVSGRVVPCIENRPEKEQYVTCYDRTVNGRKRIRVRRSQYAEIEVCDKMCDQLKLNPTKKFKSARYEWLKDSEKFVQIKCPNPVTLWVKLKDTFPHICYGFKFVNTTKTEIEFLDEQELREKYKNDVMVCERNLKKDSEKIARFKLLDLQNEQDAVDKCLTPSLEAKNKVAQIIQTMIDDSQKEITLEEPHVSFENASDVYSHQQVAGCIQKFFTTNIINDLVCPIDNK